jgi:hypothetical protein
MHISHEICVMNQECLREEMEKESPERTGSFDKIKL